jgi:ubiquinone/menaquinone biosynthesis C-methylase UbiE
MPTSIPALYNARAESYDNKTAFHRNLAAQYIHYAKPQPGESLLDLACGTGLVTYEFASVLQSGSDVSQIIGIDISPGMLEVARSKLPSSGHRIVFLEHDIADLGGLEEHGVREGGFDIITICSALVLLPDAANAIREWARYLKLGGRMVVDVPHVKSMLSLKLLSKIGPEFGIEVLGDRRWIMGAESVKTILEEAGLEGIVEETGIFGDVPAKTEEGKNEWAANEGGRIWERVKRSFDALGNLEKDEAKIRFIEEWGKLADEDGVVREEGRLYIGIGWKR